MRIREPFQRYVANHCPMMAASLSFFGFLSLLPLAMVAISILGFVFGGTAGGTDKVAEVVGGAMPTGVADVRDVVESLFARRSEIGAFGLIILLWSASSIFTNLQHAFDIVFGRTKTSGFILRRLVAIITVLALAAVMALFGVLVPFFQLFADWYARRSGQALLTQPWVIEGVSKTISTLLAICVFTLIYKVMPRGEVKMRNAMVVGGGFGVLWELMRWVFGIYVGYASRRAAIYGSLWSMILLMLWIYVSFSIVLLGAATLAAAEANRNNAGPRPQNAKPNGTRPGGRAAGKSGRSS